jgi:hypothetical protein
MIMDHNIESLPGESQSEDFSQAMCRASDKGKGCHMGIVNGKSTQVNTYTRAYPSIDLPVYPADYTNCFERSDVDGPRRHMRGVLIYFLK